MKCQHALVLKPRKSRISVKKSAKYQGQDPKDCLASLKTSFSKLGRNGPPGGETTAANKTGLDTKESEDRQADVIQTRSEGPQPDPPVAGAPQIPTTGFCIRCKTEISANPVQPYCDRHLRIWKQSENDDYPEKYCHICGSETATSRRKPLCWDCYRRYKEVFTFAVSRD